jgi:hypothetical protein
VDKQALKGSELKLPVTLAHDVTITHESVVVSYVDKKGRKRHIEVPKESVLGT